MDMGTATVMAMVMGTDMADMGMVIMGITGPMDQRKIQKGDMNLDEIVAFLH